MASREVVVEGSISWVNGLRVEGAGTNAFVDGIDVASISAATTMLAHVEFVLDGAIVPEYY